MSGRIRGAIIRHPSFAALASMICSSCGSPNHEADENCFKCGKGLFSLTEGYVLASRYEIIGALGRGGMGIVYKGYDRELDETVAIKVLRADVAAAADMARRFRSEIKLARKVRHRNVCGIHEYGQDGHRRFIAMELVEGVDVKRILHEQGPFSPGEAYGLAMQVAEGLQAIHDAGIVHRDLKTPNIMLDQSGVVRLMDFGIAKRFDTEGTTGATATGHIVGTPEYMSPEQARGEKLDARSDIYALGIVLFEIFTGRVPFRGETPVATLLKHIQEPPPLEGSQASALPADLVPILRKALAKHREDRYPSAAAVAVELRKAREAWGPDTGKSTPPMPKRLLSTAIPVTLPTERAPVATPVPTGVPTAVRTAGSVPADGSAEEEQRRVGRTLRQVSTVRPSARLLVGALLASGAALATFWLNRDAGFGRPEAVRPGSRVDATGSDRIPAEASREAPAAATVESPGLPVDQAAGSLGAQAQRLEASPSRVRAPSPRQLPLPSAGPPKASAIQPSPESPEAPAPPVPGALHVVAIPWAEVAIDGKVVGTTPLKPLSLGPGPHMVVLSNPGYTPLQKKITIRPGEMVRLQVDLAFEAFPK